MDNLVIYVLTVSTKKEAHVMPGVLKDSSSKARALVMKGMFTMLSYEKTKLKCLEICYSCIDRDISGNRFVNYETSFEQVFLYDYPKCTDIEKALWCFTLISRFARSGMLTNPNGILEGETRKNLEMVKSISSEERNLMPSQFFDDAEEAEQYINWLDRSRENE